MLEFIAREVWLHCAGACEALDTIFTARMEQARLTRPKDQVEGIVATIQRERQAALHRLREQAAAEIKTRQREAIIRNARDPLRPTKGQKERSNPTADN